MRGCDGRVEPFFTLLVHKFYKSQFRTTIISSCTCPTLSLPPHHQENTTKFYNNLWSYDFRSRIRTIPIVDNTSQIKYLAIVLRYRIDYKQYYYIKLNSI